MRKPKVSILADDDTVKVTVNGEEFEFEQPGTLTGADLEKVLEACGIRAEYQYFEGGIPRVCRLCGTVLDEIEWPCVCSLCGLLDEIE